MGSRTFCPVNCEKMSCGVILLLYYYNFGHKIKRQRVRVTLPVGTSTDVGEHLHPRFIPQLPQVFDGGSSGDSGVAGDGLVAVDVYAATAVVISTDDVFRNENNATVAER